MNGRSNREKTVNGLQVNSGEKLSRRIEKRLITAPLSEPDSHDEIIKNAFIKLWRNFRRGKPGRAKRLGAVCGLLLLLLAGSLGSGLGSQLLNSFTSPGNTIWLARLNPFASSAPATAMPTGNLSLSKEYVYAGDRLLAIEEAGGGGASGGTDTIGIFASNASFHLRNSNSSGWADLGFFYGGSSDIPLTGDWNGDGVDTIAVYSNGVFHLRNSNTGGFSDISFAFGGSGDLPISGDWNNDGTDTVGIYRPSTGVFYLRNTNSFGNPDITFAFGSSGDLPVAGDWNGDGVDTIGLFRPSTTVFYLRNTNSNGYPDITLVLGSSNDKPIAGDWDGDGDDSVGLFSSTSGYFFLWYANTGGSPDLSFIYGSPGDKPVAGDWDGQ